MTAAFDDELWAAENHGHWEEPEPDEQPPTRPHLRLVHTDRPGRGLGATPFQAGAGYARRFPVERLPEPMAAYVRDIAIRKQVPVDLPALTMLGIIGSLAGPRFVVRRDLDWTEPTNLYACCALPSGAGKSPTVEELRRGVYRANRIVADKHEQAVAREAGMLADEAEQLLRLAQSPMTPVADKPARRLAAKAKEAAAEKLQTEPPPPPDLIFDGDTTVEALAASMAANGGWGAIVDDEGTFLRVLGGMYNGGKPGNLGLVLVGYDCRYYKPARVTRTSKPIRRAALSLVLAPQPAILADVMRDQMMDQSGVINRFVVCVPGDLTGQREERPATYHRDLRGAQPDRRLRDWWADLLCTLVTYDVIDADEPSDATVLDLTFPSFKRHREYEQEIEQRLHPATGDLVKIREWGSKHLARVLRIAALLHLGAGLSPLEEISEAVMEDAIAIGEWSIEHFLAAGSVSGLSSGAGRIKEYVDGTEHGFCPRMDLFKRVFAGHADAAEIDRWLDELVATGDFEVRKVKTTGRPKTLIGRSGFAVPSEGASGAVA